MVEIDFAIYSLYNNSIYKYVNQKGYGQSVPLFLVATEPCLVSSTVINLGG